MTTLNQLNILKEELRLDESENNTFEWFCEWHDLDYRILLTEGKSKEEIIEKFFYKLNELNTQLNSLIDTLQSKSLEEEYIDDSSVYFDDIDAINKERIAIKRVMNHRNFI